MPDRQLTLRRLRSKVYNGLDDYATLDELKDAVKQSVTEAGYTYAGLTGESWEFQEPLVTKQGEDYTEYILIAYLPVPGETYIQPALWICYTDWDDDKIHVDEVC